MNPSARVLLYQFFNRHFLKLTLKKVNYPRSRFFSRRGDVFLALLLIWAVMMLPRKDLQKELVTIRKKKRWSGHCFGRSNADSQIRTGKGTGYPDSSVETIWGWILFQQFRSGSTGIQQRISSIPDKIALHQVPSQIPSRVPLQPRTTQWSHPPD